jgi:hypothetical protein
MSNEPVTGAPPVVLTFAPSDPSGGGGMQADLLTLASMGCHALTVVTAITVQDTTGVEGVLPMEAEWVADQARCLLEDMPVDAFKIGALASVENIAAVAEILADYPDVPLILDPTLSSGAPTRRPPTRCGTRCATSCCRRRRSRRSTATSSAARRERRRGRARDGRRGRAAVRRRAASSCS